MGRFWDRARCIACGELLYGNDYRNHDAKCEHCEMFTVETLFEVCS